MDMGSNGPISLFGESKVRTLGSTHLPTSYSPDCSCHEVTSVGQSILGFRDGGAAEFLQHMLRMTRKILRPFHGGHSSAQADKEGVRLRLDRRNTASRHRIPTHLPPPSKALMDLQPVMITLGFPRPNKGKLIGLTKGQSCMKPNFSLGKSRTDGRSSLNDNPQRLLSTLPAVKKMFPNDNKPQVPFKIPKLDKDIKPGLFLDGALKKEHSQMPSKCSVALTRLKEHKMVSPIKVSTNGLDILHDSKTKNYRVMSPITMHTQGTFSSPNGKIESSFMPSTSLVSPDTPPRLPIACNAQNDDPISSTTPSPEQYKTISTSYYATRKKLIFESTEKIRHSSIDKNIDSQDSRLDKSKTSERNPEDLSISQSLSKLQTSHNKPSLISSSPTHKPPGSLSPSAQSETLQSNKDAKISMSQKCENQSTLSYNMKRHSTKNQISKMSENLDINTGLPTKTKMHGDSSYNLMTHHSKSYKAQKDVTRSKKAVDKTSSKGKIEGFLKCTICQFKTIYKCNLISHVTKIHTVDWRDVAKECGIQRTMPRKNCMYCQRLYAHMSRHEPRCKEKGRTPHASSEKIQAFEVQVKNHKSDY